MLLGVFGTPSPLTYWMLAAIRSTLDVCAPNYRYVETSNLGQLRRALAESEAVPLLYFFDSPEAEVVDAFTKAGAPFLVCLEPPTEVLGFCMRAREIKPVDALRFTSMCFATLHDLVLAPNSRIVRRRPDFLASDCIIEICSTFRLTSDPALAAEAVRRIAGQAELSDSFVEDLIQRSVTHAEPLGHYSNQMEESGVPAWIVDTANQYLPMTEGKVIESVFWPREAFLDPHGQDNVLAPLQELTGPSRGLIFGPFMYLPRGYWRAVVGLEIVDARFNALTADVAVMGNPIKIVRFDLPDRGRFEFFLDFEIKEPRHFLEFRLVLLQGAIEGRFGFGGARVVRASESLLDVRTP